MASKDPIKRAAYCAAYWRKHREKLTRYNLAYRSAHKIDEWFRSIKRRCKDSNYSDFRGYGAKGIKCHFTEPQQIFDEIGPKPGPEWSLDRINNLGHYESGNIRWATPREQRLNQRPVIRQRDKYGRYLPGVLQ